MSIEASNLVAGKETDKHFLYLCLVSQHTMARDIVHEEFLYYLAHQDELVEKYNGKVIVLVNHKVVGAFASNTEAYWAAVKQYELGTFCIQLCTPGPAAYTIRAHSRMKASA